MSKRIIILVLIITAGIFYGGGCNWLSGEKNANLEINIEGEGEVLPESGTFELNSIVDLEVIPDSGWKFVKWEGNNKSDVIPILGEPRKFTIVMDKDKEISAVFEQFEDPVTLNIEIEGEGAVLPDQEIYERYSTVDLTVEYGIGWVFNSWGGADFNDVIVVDEEEGEFQIELDDDKNLIAFFKRVPLTVPDNFATIQEAIDASSDGDEIIVSEGTYQENINFNGKNVIVRSEDPENQSVLENTVIDGNNQGRVVTFENGENSGAKLVGFTIKGGYLTTENGGGIYITEGSSPVIKGNIIRENYARYGAGACVSKGSSPSFEDNWFLLNQASARRGAAIYVYGGSSVSIAGNTFEEHEDFDGVIRIGSAYSDQSSASITGNTIKNNETTHGAGGIIITAESTATISGNIISSNIAGGDENGGAITVRRSSEVEITENFISGNSADQHGAITVFRDSEVEISDNTISHNLAGKEGSDSGSGGGISVITDSRAEITGNEIKFNEAWNNNHGGGAIIVAANSEAIIDDNDILDNFAYRRGGGIYVSFGSDSPRVAITNNRITGNKAEDQQQARGGGIALFGGVMTIYGNEINNNSAHEFGGGVYIDDEVPVYGRNDEPWERNNCPPGSESHNDYEGNSHGNNKYYGSDVFFNENKK